jgi:Kef-type K+ transport system membrane component KefB
VDHGLAIDIAICIIAAWVMGVFCQAIRQPLLIAYLVAGFAIGPHGFRWVTNAESIETISQIGLSLLLFLIGLEMDLKKMLGVGLRLPHKNVAACVSSFFRFGNLVALDDFNHVGKAGVAFPEGLESRYAIALAVEVST